MNLLRIELVREMGNVQIYKIIYEERKSIKVKVVGKTFNYDQGAENFPDEVLDFAEKWILGYL